MTVRELKLAIACDTETEEIKSLNKFVDDLFNDIQLYTESLESDLIFMKGDKFIMKQDVKRGFLYCRYYGFWSILQDQHHCTYEEVQNIIRYKVEEAFNIGSLIPTTPVYEVNRMVEKAFHSGLLTPITNKFLLLSK